MTTSGTLVDGLRWRAQHQPTHWALSFLQDREDDVHRVTYAELDHAARVIAAYLQRTVQPGECVLLAYPPGLSYITAFLGTLYAGTVAVPAYPPRPNRSRARFEAIARDAKPRLMLTSSDLANVWQQIDGGVEPELQRVVTEDLTDASTDWRPPDVGQTSLAFLQYTSGSTGAPKGVMISHGNLLHNLEVIQSRFEHSTQSVGVIWLPPYHDMGLIGGILQPLYVGFPVVLMSPLACIQRPLRWLQAITEYRATTSGGPNFAYDWCVDRIAEAKRTGLELSSWDVAFNGAEPISANTLDRFAEAFAPYGFRRQAFYPCYGLAESTLYVTGDAKAADPVIHSMNPSRDHGHARSLVGCGQPDPEHQLIIADPETRSPCPEGVVGEIWVRGPSVAQGYWNRPTETEATFEAYLAASGDGPFMRTGDLGMQRQGELFVTGRMKELMIIDGRNLYPHDLEHAVIEHHAEFVPGGGVAFAIDVAGVERLVMVQEVTRACLQQKPLPPLVTAIRRAVATEYEVSVYGVALVKPGSIPKTSSGKPQRLQCRQMYLQERLGAVLTWQAEVRDMAANG